MEKKNAPQIMRSIFLFHCYSLPKFFCFMLGKAALGRYLIIDKVIVLKTR